VAPGSTRGRTAARLPLSSCGGGADTLLPRRRCGQQGADSPKRQYVMGWQKEKLGVAGGRVKEGLLSGRGMGRHSVGLRGGGRAGMATWTDPGTVVSNSVSNSEDKT